MLTADRQTAEPEFRVADPPSASTGMRVQLADAAPPRSRFAKAFQVAWLGQTVASLCWIASVFVYGVSSLGDVLQLFAASAWFIANVADLLSTEH